MKIFESVEIYLKALPADMQDLFNDLRKKIRSFVPNSIEGISYNMPSFKYKGKSIAGYAAFKKHWSYFPMSGSVVEKFKKELKDYNASKGAIQIPYGKVLPDELLKKLIDASIREIEVKK